MLEEAFSGLYAAVYFGAMAAVALWESLAPRRALSASLRKRWTGNFVIMTINQALWRMLFPMTALGIAFAAQIGGIGLFNQVAVSAWLTVVVCVVIIDLARYALHRALHNVPLLWRAHRMHHTDHDYDFTTGFRFHPLEALLTVCTGAMVIVLLGAPPLAVAISELLIAAVAIISHGNICVPLAVDRALRLIVVTPDLHRIHHSIAPGESNHNYASVFPAWDRLFATYQSQPAAGHEHMGIGLEQYHDQVHLGVPRMLADPFLPEQRAPEREALADHCEPAPR